MKTQRLFFTLLVCMLSCLAYAQIPSPSRQYDFTDGYIRPGKTEKPSGWYTYSPNTGGSSSYSIGSNSSAYSASSYSSPASLVLIESSVVIFNSFTSEIVYNNVFTSVAGEEVYFDLPVLADGEYTIQISYDDQEWSARFWIDNNEDF